MIITIDKCRVDVCNARCGDRECFQLGFDKGTFVAGRGYTKYHTDAKGRFVEYAVCMTRHLHGCPTNSVCPICRLCSIDPPGTKCVHFDCEGITEEPEP